MVVGSVPSMARPMLRAAAFVCLLLALLPAVAGAKSRAATARAAATRRSPAKRESRLEAASRGRSPSEGAPASEYRNECCEEAP